MGGREPGMEGNGGGWEVEDQMMRKRRRKRGVEEGKGGMAVSGGRGGVGPRGEPWTPLGSSGTLVLHAAGRQLFMGSFGLVVGWFQPPTPAPPKGKKYTPKSRQPTPAHRQVIARSHTSTHLHRLPRRRTGPPHTHLAPPALHPPPRHPPYQCTTALGTALGT